MANNTFYLIEMDDEIVRWALRDDKGFEEIIKRFKASVYRYCLASLGPSNKEDARDLCQEVFIKLWRSLPRYRIGTNFKGYLFSICASVCKDWARKRNPIQIPLEEERLPIEDKEDDLKDYLDELLMRLPQRQRLILFLRYKQALSYKEIANILKCPLGTVKTHLHRAIKSLKEVAKGYEGL